MKIKTDVKRGCGWRKPGGLYLIGFGHAEPCHLLPIPVEACPCCGNGIKFSRGITWIDAQVFLKDKCLKSPGPKDFRRHCCICSFCSPDSDTYGLMWVGEKYYTPESFIAEADKYGVCKRIPFYPKKLILESEGDEFDESFVMLAHIKACNGKPGIFYGFSPIRVEKVITRSMATKEEISNLIKRGIEPFIVEDDDRRYVKNPKRKIQEVLVLV